MSSGEADGVKIYDVTVVHTPTKTETNHGDWTASLTALTVNNNSNTYSPTISVGGNSTYGYYSNGTYYYYPYYYPTTVYMYQIRCPRCRKMNWAQMDTIVSCKKCSAQLRAVSKRVDFDVEVDT